MQWPDDPMRISQKTRTMHGTAWLLREDRDSSNFVGADDCGQCGLGKQPSQA